MDPREQALAEIKKKLKAQLIVSVWRGTSLLD